MLAAYIVIAVITTIILIAMARECHLTGDCNDEAMYVGAGLGGMIWPIGIPVVLGYTLPNIIRAIKKAQDKQKEKEENGKNT